MSILKIYRGRALQAALDEVVAPVEVTYMAVDRPEAETLSALAELAALTPRLTVAHRAGPDQMADRVLIRGERGSELVFVGAPLGTELAALVSAIVIAGRGDSGLAAPTRQALASLPGPVHMEVFTTPT